MGSLDRAEFVPGYLAEVSEHLDSANAQLLKLDEAIRTDGPQLRLIRELFRALHTIKGLSAMVGVEPVVQVAHEMEALFRLRDRTASPLRGESIELLLRAVRAIEQRVRSFGQGRPVEAAPAELLAALRALHGADPAAVRDSGVAVELPPEVAQKLSPAEHEQLIEGLQKGLRCVRFEFSPSPERASAGLSITTVRERLGPLGDIVKVVPRSVPKSEVAPTGLTFVLVLLTNAPPKQLAEAVGLDESVITPVLLSAGEPRGDEFSPELEPELEGVPEQSTTVRVEVARLDEALERLGALVVTRFRLEHAARELRDKGADVRALEAVLAEHRRELRDLRRALTQARMIPMRQLLERVPLLVRGMASETGKEVRLVLDAGSAELDKAVAERIFPALLHLLRNAVDHAIEPSAERVRLGKPGAGVITVRCLERAGNQLELSVSDDGAGIDRVRVANKARRPVPEDARGLLALLTLPGLSTRDVVTARSGRGMGMDIVRRVAVDILGGELKLITEPGRGTTFVLHLPMSITILDSFIFRSGAQSFAVPLAAVEEIVELDGQRVVRSPSVRGQSSVLLLRRRGENIPLLDLAALFSHAPRPGLRSAVVLHRDGERFAFAVDHMIGQQEVVVRPLEDPLVRVPGVTGTTDLGDGRPTLVLDLWAISRVAAEGSSARAATREAST